MTYAELQQYWMVKCECYLQDEAGMSWDEAVDFLGDIYSDHSPAIDNTDPFSDYSPIAEAMYEACCKVSGVFCPDNLSNPYEFLSELNPY